MTAFLGGYRLTVFAPRTVDFTEQTVLVPAAGAPHSDPFKVASIAGLAGWRPYLGLPQGGRGRVDPATKKTSIGQMSFPIIDVKTGLVSDNTSRWVTAFTGDVNGMLQLGGCKMFAEETLCGLVGGVGANGSFQASGTPPWFTNSEVLAAGGKKVDFYSATGTLLLSTTVTSNTANQLTFTGDATGAIFAITWAPFFTGRMRGDRVQGRLVRELTAQDMTADLRALLFVGMPHAQIWGNSARTDGAGGNGYAQFLCQSPIGVAFPYATLGVVAPLTGTIVYQSSLLARAIVQADPASIGAIQYGRAADVLTVDVVKALSNIMPPIQEVSPQQGPLIYGIVVPVDAQGNVLPMLNKARLHLKNLSTGAEGDFWLMFAELTANPTASRLQGTPRQALFRLGIACLGPLGIATGTPQANGAQGVGTTSLLIKGFTPSVTQILRGGDVLGFAGHNTRYVVGTDVNSDGSGNATVPIAAMFTGSGLTSAVANSEAITVLAPPRAIPLPANGVGVTWEVFVEGPPTPGNPILLNDSHPAQVIQDLCRGYFSWLFMPGDQLPPGVNYGDPKRVIPYNAGALATLLADPTFPTFRDAVTASMKANTYLERLCQHAGFVYYADGSGALTIVDARPPTTLAGVPLLTDADLFEDQPSEPWSHDPTAAVTLYQGTRYTEFFSDPTLASYDSIGDVSAQDAGAIVTEVPQNLLIATPGDTSVGTDQPLTIDFKGLRTLFGEKITRGAGAPQDRGSWAQAVMQKTLTDLEPMLAQGPATLTFNCRRNANTANLWQGSLLLLQASAVPDASSNKRGGTRALRITNRLEQKEIIQFEAIDLGINVNATAPTMGTPVLGGDVYHNAQCPITLAGGMPAEVHVAITPAGTSAAPGDTDPSWTFVTKLRSSAVASAINLAPGAKIWFRARTIPTGPQLPSAWAHSTGVTLTALPSPSALSISGILATVATLSWTNGDPGLAIAIYIASPTTDPVQLLDVLDAGATSYQIGVPPVTSPLLASTGYKIELRHRDRLGYESPAGTTTATFTTTATNPNAPNMGAVIVVAGA